MTSDYYSTLTDLSLRLSQDDLTNLIFSCGSILPPSTAEKITTGVHLFQELKQRGHLGPANFGYLRKQLVLVGRHDLASMLPDEFEILFGQPTNQDRGRFGCFTSPDTPHSLSDGVGTSMLKYCHTNMESKILLMNLSQQLNSEDTKKLAFLMYSIHRHITALELAKLLEEEGGLRSMGVINRLSACLEAIGRIDLAQQLNCFKVPQIILLSNSLSTLQQQLNLKMSLFLQSKQKSFDFHMRALHEVECSSGVRKKLLGPICLSIQESFGISNLAPLAKDLQEGFKECRGASSEVTLDTLITSSLLEALKIDQAYAMRSVFLSCREVPVGRLWRLTEQVRDDYNTFDSLVNTFSWNTTIRAEMKAKVDQHRSPYGTPAELACKYILELSREICQGGQVDQEKRAKIDCHIQTLNSNYYFCGYHVIVLQWLATLLCSFTSFGFCHNIDVQKIKETLLQILQEKRDEIMESYSYLADVVGPGILQILNIPQPEHTELCSGQSPPNPFVFLFNVLVIKLLAAATLGPEQPLSHYYLIDHDEAIEFASQVIMVSAAAMKKQVQAFRASVLLEDPLCQHVIAALTD